MNNQAPKEGFFKIKPQEKREDPKDGCILSTENTIVALNISPADFGHVIIFPKKQNVQDFTSKDGNGEYIFSEKEKLNFLEIQESAKEKLLDILNNNPELIINIYKSWIENDSLMSKITGCKERLEEVMQNYNNFKQKNVKFSGIGNYFENRGPHSGRMVSTYHTQFVPQFGKGNIIETSDALSYLLTGDRNPDFLKREEILSQKNGLIFEDEKFRAVLEKHPSSFGHVAITWKNDNIKSIKNFSGEFSNSFFEFINIVEDKLTRKINENHEDIIDFYRSLDNSELEKNKIEKIISEILSKRSGDNWIIEEDMKNKGVKEFYNGGGSFFPIIQSDGVYNFVPRYAYNRDKQGTGTAIYKAFKDLE